MKIPAFAFLVPFVLLAFLSCKPANRYPYAIRDFRGTLQPHLMKAVAIEIVGYYDSIKNVATDNELTRLSQSEHPILRAIAFREMLQRPTFNHFDLIMGDLDDTAIVEVDCGEFGTSHKNVSDDIIGHARWKDTTSKNKTIDAVITKHNYLASAYEILFEIDSKERYYRYIKEMAVRDIRNFEQTESALYALAKYKKIEDVKTIKAILLSRTYDLGSSSFRLMEEFPNEAYLEVYKNYYKHYFYRSICKERNGLNPEYFINSIASYKNEVSAEILNDISTKKLWTPCFVDTSALKEKVAYAIWNNECPAYTELRKQIKGLVKKYDKNVLYFPNTQTDNNLFKDSSLEPIKWR